MQQILFLDIIIWKCSFGAASNIRQFEDSGGIQTIWRTCFLFSQNLNIPFEELARVLDSRAFR